MWKVLLVDDEALMRESIRLAVPWTELGFELAGVQETAKQALRWIRKHKTDLIISNADLPVMNGLELLQRCRALGHTAKFVLMSCSPSSGLFSMAKSCGASQVIDKMNMSMNQFKETLLSIGKELNQDLKVMNQSENMGNAVTDHTDHIEVNIIINFLQIHYDQNVTVQSLAQLVSMEKNYLSMLFKRKSGENLISYLHHLRVEKAKTFLLQTDMKIAEVGYGVGFANENYFFRIFKRHTGQTPNDYRKRYNTCLKGQTG